MQRTDGQHVIKNFLFSLMRILSLEVFLQQAGFWSGAPGNSNLLLDSLAISFKPSHCNILKLIWFKILDRE